MIPIVIPNILTDDIFVQYGGQTGTSTVAQRQAAYAMAEGQAVQEIGTFIQPTIVTGTFNWPVVPDLRLQLDYDRVINILNVTTIHDAGCDCANDSIELTGCAWIRHAEAGIVDIRECGNTVKWACNACLCGQFGNGPFLVRIAYEAGLPTGTASDPRLLMALTTAADLNLEQMIDPSGAEGGPGDPGIKSFRSLSYSETRADSSFSMSAFGSSARANYVARMISPFKYKKAMGLGK